MTQIAEFTSRIQKKEEKILKEGTQGTYGTNTPNLKAKFFVQSIARPLAMTWRWEGIADRNG